MDLGKTGFSSDDCADCRLDRSYFLLEVFDFFDEDVTVLLGSESVDTVEKDCAVVVRD